MSERERVALVSGTFTFTTQCVGILLVIFLIKANDHHHYQVVPMTTTPHLPNSQDIQRPKLTLRELSKVAQEHNVYVRAHVHVSVCKVSRND